MPRYDYRLATGHNVSYGSLTNIESIVPAGDVAFYPPRTWGTYEPGIIRLLRNGLIYEAGKGKLVWKFGRMTRKQFRYLQTTYCNSGYSGLVTINSRLDDATLYQRCNAVMRLPRLTGVNTENFTIYQNVEIQFGEIVIL